MGAIPARSNAFDRDGVPRDVCKAANSFYLNAVAGNAASLCNLGAMYAAGLGLPRNEIQAAICYGEAALHGDATAQVNLGAMYRDGDVLVKDERYAALLFQTAAVRGYADAKFNFGRMLIAGRGCDADTYLGRQWLHMAAEQGHRGAARELEKIGDIGE